MKKITHNYNIFTFIIIFILFIIYAVFNFFFYFQGLEEQLKRELENKNILIKEIIEESTSLHLNSRLQTFVKINNDEIFNDIVSKDRGSILNKKSFEIFWKTFESSYDGKTIMHFHTNEGISFLRMHKPEKYGDDLSKLRKLITHVRTTRKPFTGYDVGVYNKLNFRTAHPIIKDGKLGGVLEIGVDRHWIIDYIKKVFPPTVVPVLFMKDSTITVGYDEIKTTVMGEFTAYLKSKDKFSKILPDHILEKKGMQSIDLNGERYFFQTDNTYTIKDIEGKILGKVILFFKDRGNFAKFNEHALKNMIISFFIFVIMIVISLVSVNKLLRKVRRREDKIIDLEQRLKLASQSTKDGLWDWDILNNELYLSSKWKEMIGFSDDELPNDFSSWQERIHPDDRDRIFADLKDHFDKKDNYYENEHRLKCKDGSYLWILARGKALFDKNEKPYRMLGFHTDISQRKQNLKLLESVVEIFKMLISSNRINENIETIFKMIISTIEADRIYIFKNVMVEGNIACSQKYEYVKEEISAQIDNPLLQNILYSDFGGERWLELFYEDKYVESIVRELKGKEREILESQNIKSILVIPLFYKNELWGFIGFDSCKTEKVWEQRDKSILKILGQAFIATLLKEEYSIDLENEVQKHLRVIREKDKLMIRQNKLASMGEMIGNIAHQWRQPLNAIGALCLKGETILEVDEKLDKKVYRDIFEHINENLFFMSKTIDDFRNFFVPTKAKEMFNIVESIQHIISIVGLSLIHNDIEVDFYYEDEYKIDGYKNEFEQVILNIINNAKEVLIASDIEKKNIKINISKVEGKVVLEIEDNGGGIDNKIIDKVFEPYFTTKFKDKGTGLGLYMSKIIIEDHMGGVLKINNSNEGVVCKVIFP